MNARMPDHHSVPMPEGRDLTPYLKQARDEIVWSVLNRGQYPEKGRAEFLLSDFLLETFYRDNAPQMVVDLHTAVMQERFDHTIRYQWEEALERYLEGHELVEELAGQMAWEDR